MGDCDLNPLTRQLLAASDGVSHIKVTFLKVRVLELKLKLKLNCVCA